ncbi:DUF4293 domain-containing protein [Arachidicoccus sp.]|uniref:DUF4293 domain-containing protein n=1 Tax=Arachidicoccus sp. TaxID=1872624 RepID=UPI003D1AED5F
MIQRIQTLWLLLVVALAALSFKFSFYVGTWMNNGVQHPQVNLNGHNPSIPVFVTTIVVLVIALISIFSYKNRKQQMLLTVVNLLLSLGLIFLYHLEVHNNFLSAGGTMALTSVFVFAIPVALIMAMRGIRRDIKLLRSADRLRD